MSIFGRLFGQTPQYPIGSGAGRSKSQLPYPRSMTVNEWQANPLLAEQADELFKEALMGHILAVLHNAIPVQHIRQTTYTGDQAAVELGRVQGYLDCLNLLESLPIKSSVAEEIEPTWGVKEEEE